MGLFSRKKKEEEKPKSRSEADRGSSMKSGPEETASLAESRRAREAVPAGEGEIATPAAPDFGELSRTAVKLPKGEDAHSYQIILKPIITEKGGLLEGYRQYLFKVTKNANKVEIKKAIEKLYKVKVDRVNVISMPSKFRRVGEHEGKKPGFKKAIVTLKKGDKIEIAK